LERVNASLAARSRSRDENTKTEAAVMMILNNTKLGYTRRLRDIALTLYEESLRGVVQDLAK